MAFLDVEIWAEFQEASRMGREWLGSDGYSFRRPARERLGTWEDAVFRSAYFAARYRRLRSDPEWRWRMKATWTRRNARVRQTPELWEKHKAYQRAYRARPEQRARRAAWRKANRARLREALQDWRNRRRQTAARSSAA